MKDFTVLGVLGGVLFTIVTLSVKELWSYVTKRRERLQANYNLAEKLMKDDHWKNMHDFQLEVGYQGFSGRRIEASIIRFFLLRSGSYESLSDFAVGQRFLCVNEQTTNDLRISLRKELSNAKALKKRYQTISVRYFLFAFVGFIPIILLPVLGYPVQLVNTKFPFWLAIVI